MRLAFIIANMSCSILLFVGFLSLVNLDPADILWACLDGQAYKICSVLFQSVRNAGRGSNSIVYCVFQIKYTGAHRFTFGYWKCTKCSYCFRLWLSLIWVVMLIPWWRREGFVFHYREFSEASFWHQYMGLFMRLVPYNHTETVEKPISLFNLNCLPMLSYLGVSLFRFYRIKILEPKHAPVEDPWRWCVPVCCTECVNTPKFYIFLLGH